MNLQDEFSILTFTSGFLVGIAIIYSLRRFFPTPFYMKTVIAVVKLFILFIKELISSSVLVIKQVLQPKLSITPGVFSLETELKGDWEITLLSLLLTLTPGSVVLEVSPEGNVLYIHAMDIPESRDVVIKAKEMFEKAIMEVTR